MPGPKVRCLECMDEIQSMYRHDFKYCKCGAIFVDGGSDYLRMGGRGIDPEGRGYKIVKEGECSKNS